jgi:hypothetical protein
MDFTERPRSRGFAGKFVMWSSEKEWRFQEENYGFSPCILNNSQMGMGTYGILPPNIGTCYYSIFLERY